VSQLDSGPEEAFRRQFSASELAHIDGLMEKFSVLFTHGVVSRKLDKWASVMNFRATQLVTADQFALSARDVAQVKKAYFHAHGKAEKEADKLLNHHGLEPSQPARTPKTIDIRKLTMDLHRQLVAVSEATHGTPLFEDRVVLRLIGTHVVLEAEVDDEPLRQASERMADAPDSELEEAEVAFERELDRLLTTFDLHATVAAIHGNLTTRDPARAFTPKWTSGHRSASPDGEESAQVGIW
jgi:hypothetical protein